MQSPSYGYKGIASMSEATVRAMLDLVLKDPNAAPELVAGLKQRVNELDFEARQGLLFEPELQLVSPR